MKIKVLFFLLFSTLAFPHLPLPTIDTSLGKINLNLPFISIPGKGRENLDFTIYYNRYREAKIPQPLGRNFIHNLSIALHYIPYELKENRVYRLVNLKQEPSYTPPEPTYELPSSLNLPSLSPIIYPTDIINDLRTDIIDEPRHYAWRCESIRNKPILPKIKVFEKGEYKLYKADQSLFYYQGKEVFYSSYHSKERIERTKDGFVKEDPKGTKYYFFHPYSIQRYIDYPLEKPFMTKLDPLTITTNSKMTIKRWGKREGEHIYLISKIEDRYGNCLEFEYNKENQLISVKDKQGRKLSFEYSLSFLSKVTTPKQRTIALSYNQGNLSQITFIQRTYKFLYDQNRLTRIIYPNKRSISFSYYPNGYVEQVNDSGRIVSYKYEHIGEGKTRGLKTTFTKDNKKTIHDYKEGYFQDQDNKTLEITDPEGNIWITQRNENKLITKRIDPNNGSFTYKYDEQRRMIELKDPENGIWRYSYTNYNRIKEFIDPKGNKTSFKYDNKGNLIETEFPDNSTKQRTYDEYGQIKSMVEPDGKTTFYEYDDYGNLTKIKDEKGILEYSYDLEGNLLSIKDKNNNKTEFTYDDYNNLISLKDPLGNKTQYEYDIQGNIISLIDKNNNKTTFIYDIFDNLIETKDPQGNKISYNYDNDNNLISIIDQENNKITYTYSKTNKLIQIKDQMGNITRYSYDKVGNLKEIIDPNNNKTEYAYDLLNRLIQVKDPLLNITRYTYDPLSNLLSIIDANNHKRTYDYDKKNRLIEIKDPLGNKTTYNYSCCFLSSRKDAKNNLTGYFYDNGELKEISYPDTSKIEFNYDKEGNLISFNSPQLNADFLYDPLNRIKNITIPSLNKGIAYSYDKNGNRRTMTSPEGTTTYLYNNLNQLTELTNPYNEKTSYAYYPNGLLKSKTQANGITTIYTYDNIGRLTKLTHPPLPEISYTYDPAGNRLTMTMGSETTRYEYDNLYRLTKVIYPNGKEQAFTYDNVGNRLSLNTISYTYDAADRLLKAGEISYSYDNNGNLIKKDNTSYTYDYENRLIQITFFDNSSQTFTYCPLGKRI
ncbi:MAG: hypothetical protein AB1397_00770, partial [bacterium]